MITVWFFSLPKRSRRSYMLISAPNSGLDDVQYCTWSVGVGVDVSYRQKWPRAEAGVSYSQQRGDRRFDVFQPLSGNHPMNR